MMTQHSDSHLRHRLDSHTLSRHHHAGPGVARRVGVSADLRSTVRLDPDPRNDPPDTLTAQVRAALSGSIPLQTDPPVWGLPPGAAHA